MTIVAIYFIGDKQTNMHDNKKNNT